MKSRWCQFERRSGQVQALAGRGAGRGFGWSIKLLGLYKFQLEI